MSAALVLQQNAITIHDAQQREALVLTGLTNAYQTATAVNDIVTRTDIVQSLTTLRAAAKAYKLSSDTYRKVTETHILCLRLLGISMKESMPKTHAKDRAAKLGLETSTCKNASYIAVYSEERVREVFEALRTEKRPIGYIYVINRLRDDSPRVQNLRVKKHSESTSNMARRREELEADPDRKMIEEIWASFEYNYVNACRRLLEMGRENSQLKKHIEQLTTSGLRGN